MNYSWKRIAAITLLVLMMVLLGAQASRVQAGSCIVAKVPTEFTLPDNSSHPAGTLRLCLQGRLNPVTELQEISVMGKTAGLFQGTTFHSEEKKIRGPLLYFREAQDETWVLLGLAEPSPHRNGQPRNIRFADQSRARELGAPRPQSEAIAMVVPNHQSVIVLAAR